MEHVVFHPASDGTPAFRRLPSLEDAVRLVEHLRNVEGVAEVSVHALTEVPLAFRAYYKVEVPGAVEPAGPVVPVQAGAESADDAPLAVRSELSVEPAVLADAPVHVEEPVPAGANGSPRETAPSLGFFA